LYFIANWIEVERLLCDTFRSAETENIQYDESPASGDILKWELFWAFVLLRR
jgi:hypothetical protein